MISKKNIIIAIVIIVIAYIAYKIYKAKTDPVNSAEAEQLRAYYNAQKNLKGTS